MDTKSVLALYDEQMRRHRPSSPTQSVEQTGAVTRILGNIPGAEFGAVLYSALTESTADATIEEQIRYFSSLGRAFEWKAYGHDRPADLEDRLAKRGFRPGDKERLLCLNLAHATGVTPPAGISIERLENADEVEAISAFDEARGEPENEPLLHELRSEMKETPSLISVYVARFEGRPVSRGWIRFYEGRDFADLWGGGTLREFRRRGIYQSLVSARAREAKGRDVRFLATDALPSSQPILERMGFVSLTSTTPYLWVPF